MPISRALGEMEWGMKAAAHALFIFLILIGAIHGCGLWAAGGGAFKGKRLYEEHCMVCHGQGGKGVAIACLIHRRLT